MEFLANGTRRKCVCVGIPELTSDQSPSDLHRHSLYYQHICKLFNPIDCHMVDTVIIVIIFISFYSIGTTVW